MQKPSILTDEAEKDLWQAWIVQRDPEARRKLIDHHLPFAHMLAAKLYAGRQVAQIEFHEYRQYAIVGMIEAVDRFEANRNISFKTFAGHRVQGSILNGVETACEKQQQITARANLRKQRMDSMRGIGKRSSDKDLFSELADLAIGLALGYMLEDSGMYRNQEQHYTENFYDRHELNELKKNMNRIVDILPEQARDVIRYHYFHGMSFDEIAKLLSLTNGRISQIHRQALKLLQEIYSGKDGVNLSL
jgi:RNA polymerase sigma factor for flagellar operon FliA